MFQFINYLVLLPAQIRWVKPQQGIKKCNIDTAFSEALNRVGFGMCLRDAAGSFIRAKMMWTNPMCTPEVGEVLGLFYAIQWVQELQLSNVDFEMNAEKVVDFFNKGSNDVSEFGSILEECKRCRNAFFENSKVEFSRRQANEVTHTLARKTIFLAGPHVFNDAPLCILTLINNEKL